MTVLASGMATLRSQARALRDVLKHPSWRGDCPICEAPTRFIAYGDWWRDDRWARDEWDVAVNFGKHGSEQQAIYRIYRELNSDAWFVEGAYD